MLNISPVSFFERLISHVCGVSFLCENRIPSSPSASGVPGGGSNPKLQRPSKNRAKFNPIVKT